MKYIGYLLLAFGALWLLATVIKGVRQSVSNLFGQMFTAGLTAK